MSKRDVSIDYGKPVVVRTADGKWLRRRATSPIVDGGDFSVVWITDEEEWKAAHAENRDFDARPWPCEDVFLVDQAPAVPAPAAPAPVGDEQADGA